MDIWIILKGLSRSGSHFTQVKVASPGHRNEDNSVQGHVEM